MLNFSRQTPFIGCESTIENSDTVIFGVPFDGTTSFRPGARFGPAAIRNESFGIETFSPYCNRDLEDFKIADMGDLELPFGNTERVLAEIENTADEIFLLNKRPVMLGGEHLASLGAIRAAKRHYGDLVILHFDAHADLRSDYMGERLSHATVMRRVYELVGDGQIYQFGIRSGERAEFEFAAEHTIMERFTVKTVSDVVKNLRSPVYLSIDLDVLDSSVLPGTGTPEAGGISFLEFAEAINALKGLNIVGADIVELAPHYDQSGASTAVACKILRELLLIL